MALLFFASCASSIAAQTLTIKKTFGEDEESLGDYNLYSYSKETDINGDTVTNSGFALGNSTQADWVSEHLDARIKLEFLYQNIDSDEITFGILPTGYVYYEPIKQFGIIVGNNFIIFEYHLYYIIFIYFPKTKFYNFLNIKYFGFIKLLSNFIVN